MNFAKNLMFPVFFAIAGIVVFITTDSTLWIACFLLAAFLTATKVFGLDKSKPALSSEGGSFKEQFGMLGNYVVDGDQSYGLFICLLNRPVFVDLCKDEFLAEREKHAIWLFEHNDSLERNLEIFFREHTGFQGRVIDTIGLHAKQQDQGEVFWDPEGYTILRGLHFLPEP